MAHPRAYGGNVPPPGDANTGGKDVGGVSKTTSKVATTVSKANIPPPSTVSGGGSSGYKGNKAPPGPNPGLGGTKGNVAPPGPNPGIGGASGSSRP